MCQNRDETATPYVLRTGIPALGRAELLTSERRRRVVDVLSDRSTPVELGALAAEIATQEERFDAQTGGVTADVEIDLHHSHLPMLDDAGIIDYDPELHRVTSKSGPVGSDDTEADRASDSQRNATLTIDLGEYVVDYFDVSTSETASLDDLARFAAMRLSDADDRPAERIRLRLHHAVLPKLADAGLIDYDPRTTTAQCRECQS